MYSSYFLYIAKYYAKNLILILLGITFAVTLIDYLQYGIKLSDAGNQMILYLFYTWEFRLSQFYPLSIVFASVITYMSLVQSNSLVSFLSFGYSRRQLFLPFIFPAFVIYVLLLLLQMGEFSYAKERAKSILKHTQNLRVVNDLFFKYNDTFVYVKKLDPIKKELREVTVFSVRDRVVQSAMTLDRAIFDGEYWIAKEATIISKSYSPKGTLIGFERKSVGTYKILKGYKPKVIKLIYEGESLSLLDAMNTYSVLVKQGLDANKIKASFYYKTFLPLFSFAMMTILFFKSFYYARYMNKELVWALSLGGTLVIWGLLYALYSLSAGGAISPDVAMVLPVCFLLLYAVYLYIDGGEKLA